MEIGLKGARSADGWGSASQTFLRTVPAYIQRLVQIGSIQTVEAFAVETFGTCKRDRGTGIIRNAKIELQRKAWFTGVTCLTYASCTMDRAAVGGVVADFANSGRGGT